MEAIERLKNRKKVKVVERLPEYTGLYSPKVMSPEEKADLISRERSDDPAILSIMRRDIFKEPDEVFTRDEIYNYWLKKLKKKKGNE